MNAETRHIHILADHVALTYHEARNVRHLVKAGFLDVKTWKFLIALPTNRVDAWVELQPLRRRASEATSPGEVLDIFGARFRVSLQQLLHMFANPAWRGSGYGGNAWQEIAAYIFELVEALKTKDVNRVQTAGAQLVSAHHNTGTIADKLSKLDAHIANT